MEIEMIEIVTKSTVSPSLSQELPSPPLPSSHTPTKIEPVKYQNLNSTTLASPSRTSEVTTVVGWKRIIFQMIVILLAPAIFSTFIVLHPHLIKNYPYFMAMFATTFLVLFWNFSYLVIWNALRPTYYEDLYDDDAPALEKEWYQRLYIKIITFPLVLFIAGLSYYILHEMNTSNFTLMQEFGLIGGAVSLYTSFQDKIRSVLLWFLHRSKKGLERRRNSL